MAGVELDGVTKVFADGTRAVSGLDLEVGDGEFVVLVGPSGCGKTTALRMTAGLEDVTEGEIRIGGRTVNRVPPKDRDIAMVFQSYALYPHMTVADNIAFGLKLRRVDKAEIRRRVEEAARILGLDQLLDKKPRTLSGGQRQRVAMGRAIVREPQAFMMDEPLSNLDAKLRVQMRAEIASLQRTLGVTTIYVTHDQVEAMTMADRVAVLRRGVLQQVDRPQALYDAPDNLFVAGFIGSPAMNVVEGSVDGDDVAIGEQRLRLPHGLPGYQGRAIAVGIRPEDMEDASLSREHTGNQRLRGTVDLVEALGASVLVHFSLAARTVVTEDTKELAADVGHEAVADLEAKAQSSRTSMVASFSARSRVQAGQAIDVAVDTARLHFFDIESGQAIRRDT